MSPLTTPFLAKKKEKKVLRLPSGNTNNSTKKGCSKCRYAIRGCRRCVENFITYSEEKKKKFKKVETIQTTTKQTKEKTKRKASIASSSEKKKKVKKTTEEEEEKETKKKTKKKRETVRTISPPKS